MTNSMLLNKASIRTKMLSVVAAVLAAVALPQMFHFVGAVSGAGSELGAAFLPMHLPVFLAGLLAGPVVGGIAGILSPLVSFGISGMPVAVMLPNIMAELAGYGIVSGLLFKAKMPLFVKLVIAQIAGHVLKAAAILLAVHGFGSQAVPVSLIWNSVLTGLPGILLQWSLIPLIVFWIENRKRSHE